MHLGRRSKVPFPASYNGFRLIRTHGRVYAFPPGARVERILTTTGLMDQHPAVLSAATLEEVQRLVDGYDVGSLATEVVGSLENYTIVRFRAAYYAVPRTAGDIDLDVPEERRQAGVIAGSSPEDLARKVPRLAAGAPVEFAGWLPIFGTSGNCGSHPQFKHTGNPPAGYRFTRSAPQTENGPARTSTGTRVRAALFAPFAAFGRFSARC